MPFSIQKSFFSTSGAPFLFYSMLPVGDGIPSDNLIERQKSPRWYPLEEKGKKKWGSTPGSTFYVCWSGAPL